MGNLLIKNGTIVTATDHYRADVLVADEKVAAIAETLDESADRVIDAEGCYLFPGGIDAHTHMELPFMGTLPVTLSTQELWQGFTVAPPPSLISPSRPRGTASKPLSRNGTARRMGTLQEITPFTAR